MVGTTELSPEGGSREGIHKALPQGRVVTEDKAPIPPAELGPSCQTESYSLRSRLRR